MQHPGVGVLGIADRSDRDIHLAGVAGSGPYEWSETGIPLRPNAVKPGFHSVRLRRGSVPRIPLSSLCSKSTIGNAAVDRNHAQLTRSLADSAMPGQPLRLSGYPRPGFHCVLVP